jgi:hypothetical protein
MAGLATVIGLPSVGLRWPRATAQDRSSAITNVSTLLATQYPLRARVHDIGPMLAVFCSVAALGDVLYWPTYHTYFAVIGDAHHRGHPVRAREALVVSVGVVAPLLGVSSPLRSFRLAFRLR